MDSNDTGKDSTTVEGQSGSNGEWYAGPGGGEASSSGANSGDDDDDESSGGDEEISHDDDEDSSGDNTTAGMVVSTSVARRASSMTVSTSEPSALVAATVHGTVTVSTTDEGRDLLCLESNLQVGGSTYEAFINALGDVGVALSGNVDLSCGGGRLSRRLQSESVELRYSVSFSSTSDAVSFSNDVSFSATAVSTQFESQVASSLGLEITATVGDVSVTLNSAPGLTGGSHIPHEWVDRTNVFALRGGQEHIQENASTATSDRDGISF